MTGGHFLGEEDRAKLIALALDELALDELALDEVGAGWIGGASGDAASHNAGVLLDGGWSCRAAAAALLLGGGTVRNWRNSSSPAGLKA